MRSFRLDSGEEMTVWGWLLVAATVFIELWFIGTAVQLGIKEPSLLVTLVVGVAGLVFVVGGWLLEKTGLNVFNSQKKVTKKSSNEL
jgi:hypothetical protein